MSAGDGGPVFPKILSIGDRCLSEGGMTLRDYAIIAMMQSLRQSEAGIPFEDRMHSARLVKAAIEDADAMLAERDKP